MYKFLVLKNDDELTILANIHSSIFDYSSIKKFYELFNSPNDIPIENNTINRYNQINDYLSSSEFEKDSIYWKKHLLDVGNYVKFYNIKSSNYKNIKIPLNNKTKNFLNQNNIPKFEFMTVAFSLYLSRINRSDGCLLKTSIPDNDCFDKNTLLKIEYLKDNSFMDYLNEIKDIYNLSVEHTKVDVENYIEEELSYYSIYDFTKLENISVENSAGSALTLNIYDDFLELIYNSYLFSDVFINHMARNFNHVLGNFSDSLAEFFVQIYQNGENYRTLFANSNKYSDKMIEDFKNTFISILSNIINADISSDLDSTLK